MTDKAATDWERIEQLYRAGVLSLREIATACPGVNHVAITRRAKKYGWVQDLSAKIKAKADDLVTRQAVTKDVTAKCPVTDKAIIELNAQTLADMWMGQRRDIGRARRLANRLLEELEGLTEEQGTIKELIVQLKGDGDGAEMADVLALASKMSALPGRTKTMRELSETLKTLITLERIAYEPGSGGPVTGSVTRIELVSL